MNLEIGMLAKIKAGHDKDSIYVITDIDDKYVYLADGAAKPVCNPKKKNRKHIQPITYIRCDDVKDNESVRYIVKKIVKEV